MYTYLRVNLNPVFPAHAGMFRLRFLRPICCLCFPRARGDVPGLATLMFSLEMFSPRTRGCSYECRAPLLSRAVFPAHAGMFRLTFRIS